MLAALLLLGMLPFAAMPYFETSAEDEEEDDSRAPDRGTPRVDLPGPVPAGEAGEDADPAPEEQGDLYRLDAASGDRVLADFAPGVDELEVDLTNVSGEIFFETGAGPDGAVLALGAGEASVMIVQFPGLEEVPAADVSLRLVDEASGEPFWLSLAEAQAEESEPAKPVLDTEAPVIDDFPFDPRGSEVLEPVDPETPDAPGPDVEGEVLDPVDPDARDEPGPEVEGEVLDPVEPLTPPGPAAAPAKEAARVPGFVPGEDKLQLSLEPPGADPYAPDITVTPSADGADGLVRVDGALVAVLQGAPGATPQDVEAVVLPPPAP